MVITKRFGKKLKVPSTFQVKHQLLLFWLKNQVAREAAEVASKGRAKNAAVREIARLRAVV
jgi:hypothetical protein